MIFTEEDGKYLINIAKNAIETYLKTDTQINPPSDCANCFKENYGAFVTLNKNNQLRGCIGYPKPVMPLINAIIESSIAAACSDPRFEKLKLDELKDIDIEITVLTPPTLINVNTPEEYLDNINIGEDGLIVEQGYRSGLLLPQVAVENNMDKEEFLSHTCMKAGLYSNTWMIDKIKLYKFQGQIFK